MCPDNFLKLELCTAEGSVSNLLHKRSCEDVGGYSDDRGGGIITAIHLRLK